MSETRPIVCVSDHTGLTAEAFGRSLISRFDGVEPAYSVRPFVDSMERARAVAGEIEELAATGPRPIVFTTFSDHRLQEVIEETDALVISIFAEWVDRVSTELGQEPSNRVSNYHGIGDVARYQLRLDAVDFALTTDDGLGIEHYARADAILVGVSRVGKTPTCLYLSMHYGLRAANYPISIEDNPAPNLPETLRDHRERLYGLTIEPHRLHNIRMQRRPGSPYAELEMCRKEIRHAEQMFRAEGIPFLDTTSRSIEEITSKIIEDTDLTRKV